MGAQEKLLNPTGSDRRAADSSLAPRPASLRGLTVGLLGNTKPNAEVLLSEIASELKDRYDVGEFRSYTKDYFGTPVKPDLLAQIVAECDLVVTAVGDCGSCSAATVADGILFERAGVPAVSIVSDSFLLSAGAMAQMQGFPGFEFAAVHHPVASLGEAELRDRVLAVLPDVLRIIGAQP
ncbi:UGSC family (seleno)protein [Trebonia sp.]|uniref:UGSC family (seleno)protein n=1 Tax=Trebonia sp. TaxID=2767075 RepID=UPI0026080132|nr:UGSC family (seleno)protein [Trebonia sp.]